MQFIVDASSLIALHQLDWLSLLDKTEYMFFSTPKVRGELKKNRKLSTWVRASAVVIGETNRITLFDGISETDSEVISVAMAKQASILSEDVLLGQKAEKLRVPTFDIAGLVVLLYVENQISKNECLGHLSTLASKRFISKKKYRQLVESIKP